MNTSWSYLILTGTINLKLIIFAIQLSFHLLNVILIFEIPDREADIHSGKTNFIVNHGRKNSFPLITILFWFTSIYFFSLAIIGGYSAFINFYLITILSCIPLFISIILYLKKSYEQTIATKSAIQIALSLFLFSISMMAYFIILQF